MAGPRPNLTYVSDPKVAGSSLAITDEHVALAETVRRWVGSKAPTSVARTLLDAPFDELPSCWSDLLDTGWLGLALSERNGGAGYGLPELGIVLEEMGRTCIPGPFLPTAATAIALDRWGGAEGGGLAQLLAGGDLIGGVSLGEASPVWSGPLADAVLAAAPGRPGRWGVLERAGLEAAGGALVEQISFDPTRRLARLDLPGDAFEDAAVELDDTAAVPELVAVLAAAEALGVGQWCVDTAAAYACDRVQFGRPIGQFQAVKHRCADMLCRLEAARALVWDALAALDTLDDGWQVAVAAAAATVPGTVFDLAKDCIQVLGGIGYTWEHDAHIFLRRATATHQLLPTGVEWRSRLAGAVAGGAQRPLRVDLPAEAETIRPEVAAFVDELAARPREDWNAVLAESGYLVPHWPEPYGLDASPVRQVVIDQELRRVGVRRPHLKVGTWVLPTLIAHGSAAQQERFVLPTMRLELNWCQMFSEPGAGSDLASLTTKAVRVEDDRGSGWSITGQKVWTTMARQAQWAICLARTNPGAPKHEGIGCFLVDMTTPGIDIRPLKELTGFAMFNEIFLDDVFVPDDCVVGGPTEGWACARTTLANERVSMAEGSSFGPGVRSLFDLAARDRRVDDPLVVDRLGALVATEHAIAMLGVRTTLRALGGAQPGPEASVRKLVAVHQNQDIQEVGLDLLGPSGAVVEGDGAAWTGGFLGNRALSIAGGTSEIQRNVIAERLLGLPKDP